MSISNFLQPNNYSFYCNNIELQSINVTGNSTIGGTLTVAGTTTLNGTTATTLNTSGTITSSGGILSTTLSTTGDIDIAQDANITGALSVTGSTVCQHFTSTGITDNGTTIDVTESIIPIPTGTIGLGNSTHSFISNYLNDISFGGYNSAYATNTVIQGPNLLYYSALGYAWVLYTPFSGETSSSSVIGSPLTTIASMEPIQFYWNTGLGDNGINAQYSFNGSSINSLIPGICVTDADSNITGINMTALIPILTAGIQALNTEVTTLQSQVATLQSQVSALMS